MTELSNSPAPGFVRISSGVVVNDFHLQNEGEPAIVESGGTAINTTVDHWWDFYVHGEMSDTIIKKGEIIVECGGRITNTVIHESSYVEIRSGGTMYHSTIKAGGGFLIHKGGVVTGIEAEKDAKMSIIVSPDTYVQGASNGSAFEIKDGFVSNYTVHAGNDLFIVSGGTAADVTIEKDGLLSVKSGGLASNIIAQKGAKIRLEIAPNTFAQGTLNGSKFEVRNGVLSNYNITSGGKVVVLSGGIVKQLKLCREGLRLFINSGGIASGFNVEEGAELIINAAPGTFALGVSGGTPIDIKDGKACGLIINSGCILYVDSGGTASDIIVDTGGRLVVFRGGSANHTTICSGGTMRVLDGGIAYNTTDNNAEGKEKHL